MPTIDSRVVNAAIRSEIRPLLREQSFTYFTPRTAWRFVAGRIEVVNFQSFNAYTAGVIGCTTHSFAVKLGSYITLVPDIRGSVKRRRDALLPQEFQCHLRGSLHRSFAQAELQRRDIWFIDRESRYLSKAIHDVRMLLASEANAWFVRLRDNAEVLRILTYESEDVDHLWGFGSELLPNLSRSAERRRKLKQHSSRRANYCQELSAGHLPRPPLKRLGRLYSDRRHAACIAFLSSCGKRRAARSARTRGLAAAQAIVVRRMLQSREIRTAATPHHRVDG